MGKAFDELESSLKQAIAYKQGDKTAAKIVTVKTKENLKLHIKETNEYIEHFEEFTFNPYDRWDIIYDNVIDPITEKYWNSKNRKLVIENKIKKFYEEFKNYEQVRIAYNMFLDSDREFSNEL